MMSAKPSKVGPILSIAAASLVASWLILLLPTSLGGPASYMITFGNSMEPGIHQGDLVILREAREYRIGDAVAYRDPTIGRVFHRIVRRDGDTFVMQGDNNSWTDDYQPTEGEIVGEQWIHLPGMGKWLDLARKPVPMMMLAGFAGLLLVAPKRAVQRLRKRAHRPPARRQEQPQYSGGGGPAGILGPDGQTIMTVVGVLALTSVVLALLAFSQPTEQETTEITEYQHTGAFDYSAQATSNVYEGGEVEAGQPVYRALVDTLDLSFAYELTSELPIAASGTYRLDAIVSYDEGLTRTIPLVPETPFEGPEFTAEAQVALSDAQQFIDQVAQQIGGASGQHTVSFVPTVNLTGAIGGQAIEESFAPALEFEFDNTALRPAGEVAAPEAGEQAADSLAPVQTGTVESPATEAATISLLMLDVEVATARQAAIFGLVLSVLAGAILGGLYLSARRAAEPRQIQARYRPLLIKVNGSDLGVNGRVVEVASIEDLARVAEREGRMILHQQRGEVHDYFVQDVDVTYCYTSTAEPSLPAGRAMEPSR